MPLYIAILLVLISFAWWNPFLEKHHPLSIFLFLLIGLVLIVFSGIRYDVGYDYMSYRNIYDNALVMDTDMKEAGFAWMMHLCRIWRIPFGCVVFVFAGVTVCLALRFIWQYSPFVFLSLLIFYCFGQYYFNSFNAMRQVLVVYAFLSSLHWISGRKWLPYFLLMGMCTVFVHATALLLLPLYFLLHRDYSFLLKLLLLVCGVLGVKLFVWLIGLSGYAIYLQVEEFAVGVSISTWFLLLLSLLFFVWDFFQGRDLPGFRLFFNLNYLSLFTLMLAVVFGGTPLIMAANRLSYYFTPVYLVFIPIAIVHFWVAGNYFLHTLFWIVVFSAMFYVTVVVNGVDNHLIPYQTIFNL